VLVPHAAVDLIVARDVPASHESRPIPILYLMDMLHWGDTVAGTEGQFLQLLKHLDRERFDPHLALFRPTSYTDGVTDFPCPVTVLNINKLVHVGALLKLVSLSSLIREKQIRLVHIFLNDASIVAPFFCRIAGAQVIVSRRDMGFWYTKGNLAALRVSNLFVSRVIANSDAVRRNVHDREHIPLSKIEVCFNGHDPARFAAAPVAGFRERYNIGPADPIIGMVANFNPWKRHIDLVRAFARVREAHPTAHLVLVGTGDTDACRAAARESGLASAVHFVEGVAEAVPVVKHFTVGVLCSASEGASNAVIEYMGSGKPTICTNVGGNTELIQDEETGFLVAPGDVDTLAGRISLLLARPQLGELMGYRAHQAARRFTSHSMAECHMSLYEQIAQAAGRHEIARSRA
jgi:glycosyltransferase involved in cell wall biosynthesis